MNVAKAGENNKKKPSAKADGKRKKRSWQE
jgi:hypothetical protein